MTNQRGRQRGRPAGSTKPESISGLARAAGLFPKTALERIRRGWPRDLATTMPSRRLTAPNVCHATAVPHKQVICQVGDSFWVGEQVL